MPDRYYTRFLPDHPLIAVPLSLVGAIALFVLAGHVLQTHRFGMEETAVLMFGSLFLAKGIGGALGYRKWRRARSRCIRELRLISDRELEAGGRILPCTIGRGGIRADKREGDLATPAGQFRLMKGYFRLDRFSGDEEDGEDGGALPDSFLPFEAMTPEDGWCDDPASRHYNRPVKLPFPAHHETLWREDHIYDIVIPVDYNMHPVVKGKGSAIFLHIMREDGAGTEGCIALKKEDLLSLLPYLSPLTRLVVPAPA
ncbi:MAG: L,D-transpeptidase family protein [Alphaproteobacteria bacterium]